MTLAIGLLFCMTQLLLTGEALPSGTDLQNYTSCGTSGQVTNVIIQGGGAGTQVGSGQTGQVGPAGEAGPPGERGAPGTSVGGVSFTRWGRSTCPNTDGMQLLYSGAMVGSGYLEGGSAEYICLHNEPQFLRTTAGLQPHRARLYGTEYEFLDSPPTFGNLLRHDAPCALCYTQTRTTKITIPGRTSCPTGWTREYYGYYMSAAQYVEQKSRAPVCMDVNLGSVPGSAPHTIRSLIHFMEVTCTGIRCPPYFNGAEITCTVCTK